MIRQGYDPRKVLRMTDNKILREYFNRQGLLQQINFGNRKETDVEDIFEAISSLAIHSPRDYREVDMTLRRIYEMSGEDGIMKLIQEGQEYQLNLNETLVNINGNYNKSFRVFLDHPEVFQKAEMNHFLSCLQGWKEIDQLPAEPIEITPDKLNSLESRIRDYFKTKEGRGHRCKVEYYQRGQRTYFCAYPEDYSVTDIIYDQDNTLERVNRKPVIQIYFLHDAKNGRLFIKTRGGFDKKRELQNIFIEIMISPELIADKNRKIYQLNQFINSDFVMATPPEDNVGSINIKMIRFTYFKREIRILG